MSRKLQILTVLVSLGLAAVLLFGATGNKPSSPEETYRHLGVFTEVLAKIKSDYVEEPDMKNVTLGAVNGLLETLDPYASYLSADQFKLVTKSKTEKKADVGLLLARRFGYISIMAARPGSPGAKAGLFTGDTIETINNVSTRDMPLAYAESMLRGDAGTNVELSVFGFRKPEPQKISLVRALPLDYPVESKLMESDLGYIKVQSLEGNRVDAVATALRNLEKQGAKQFILDLRNCSVGEPGEGVKLANLFLDNGMMAYTQGQKSPRNNLLATPDRFVTKAPLTLILNRSSASGAEVATAALMELRRAKSVGERTYGDAALRSTISLDDGSAVILSTAKFYSPEGKPLQDVGVNPTVPLLELDVAAEADDDDEENPAPKDKAPAPVTEKKDGEDVLLKKAVEIARKGLTPAEETAHKTALEQEKAAIEKMLKNQ